MQSSITHVRQKAAFYGIQHPITGLYARLSETPPAQPELAEDGTDSVAARQSYVRFCPWPVATWFRSFDEAQTAFARYIGVSPLEIVRRDA